MTVTLLRVGGSLLSRPDLPDRLRAVLAGERFPRPLVLVGGGGAADVVREWDRLHALGDEAAHELALWSLDLTAALFARLLVPESVVCVDRPATAAAWNAGRLPVLAVRDFVEAEEEAAGERLRRSWDVTSDSIAAWIASRWPAELVLLKAAPLPAGLDWPAAAEAGLVDRCFPRYASGIRVRWLHFPANPPK